MKLRDMSTRQMAEALCAIAPPMCRIAQDPAVSRAIECFCEGSEAHAPLLLSLGRMAEALAPMLLRDHLQEVCEILSALTGKSTQELLEQSALDTLQDLQSLWDGELLDFFACAGSAAQRSC